ncbi:MAG: hypothetical protein NVSMB21_04400 [Vulcanimicrobiaceae bacterium]
MKKTTLVIIPGFNEPDKDLATLARGRRHRPGLEARGYRCELFPVFADTLSDRVDRYADYLDGLRARGVPFPIVSVGFSLGGLVARGFLRRYPERAHEVEHTITLGTPHWGVTADMLPMLTAFLRLQDRSVREMDLRSEFMTWLNGTGGHWIGRGKDRNWFLDYEPWIAPPHGCVFSISGSVPRFGGDNDGIVWKDSATLGGRIPNYEIKDPHAYHLNLIGAFNPGTLLIKGFTWDDRVWQHAIAAIARHLESHVVAESAVS